VGTPLQWALTTWDPMRIRLLLALVADGNRPPPPGFETVVEKRDEVRVALATPADRELQELARRARKGDADAKTGLLTAVLGSTGSSTTKPAPKKRQRKSK
jgi:hypothetical protein